MYVDVDANVVFFKYYFNSHVSISVPTVPPFAISTFSISGLMAGIKIESIFFFFF